MKSTSFVVSTVLLVVGLTVGTASAQCTFPQPKKAKDVTLALIPAFVSCGGPCNLCGDFEESSSSPNTSTGISIPGCDPPETFNEDAGSPANGWLWGPKSEGSVSFTAAKNKIAHPSNPINTADVQIRVRLRDVQYAGGAPANGLGYLRPVSRGTTKTRASGTMTVIDAPLSFPVQVTNGRANVRTSLNVELNNLGTSLPGCTALELLHAEIVDENGNAFARPGLFVANIPEPTPTPPATPTPTPTQTGPTPTATPRMRCCEKPGPDGCADLASDASPAASCAGVYGGSLETIGTVCDGATGTCEDMRTAASECCQFLLAGEDKCIEGPSWDATHCTAQFNGTSFSNQVCRLDGTCGTP